MRTLSLSRAATGLLSIFLLAAAPPALPFYNWEGDNGWFELRGVVRAGVAMTDTPASKEAVAAEATRLIAQGGVGDSWGYEMSLFQSFPLTDTITLPGIERSNRLAWSGGDLWVSVDSLYIEYHTPVVNIKMGRQPLNLATTYFFSPNDLFAPFATTAAYRVYKAGVDGIRADYSWDELSQLSYIAIAGYSTDLSSVNGWGDYDTGRNTSLIRVSTPMGDIEWSLMAGKVSGDEIVAGGFQGELPGSIGFRGEGNRRKLNNRWQSQLVIGLDYRWQNELHLQGEIFFNGPGATTVSDYPVAVGVGSGTFLANRYLALGLNYPLTPLLAGSATLVHNGIDSSNIIALNATYSLSDEGELSVGLSIPTGAKPVGSTLITEFGASGTSLVVEARYYF